MLKIVQPSYFLILAILLIYPVSSEVIDCALAGYNSTVLKCSSCLLLSKYDLAEIKNQCLQCCVQEIEETVNKRFAKARLEICTCKFGAYPQIQAFIKSELPTQYPNLQIRYVHGRDPIIKLIDDTGEVKEVVAIEKWNTESVDEFLRTHLEQNTADYLRTNLV